MINLKRNKKTFYLCKKVPNSTQFSEAEEINLHYEPTNSTGEILVLGQDYSEYLRITCTVEEGQKFSNGDKCYIYSKKPEEHDKMAKNADYIVEGNPQTTLNETRIMLRKLSGNQR